MRRDLELLAAKGIEVEPVVFDGGHEWAATFVERCGGYLAELGA